MFQSQFYYQTSPLMYQITFLKNFMKSISHEMQIAQA